MERTVIGVGFAAFAEEEKRQRGAGAGEYRRAAVGCWFTAGGRAIPKLLKYEDDSGCLQTLRDIRVLRSDQKYYGSLLVREYFCSAFSEEKEARFLLLYHPDSGTWDIVPDT